MKQAEIGPGARFLEGDRRGSRWTVERIAVVGVGPLRALIVRDDDPNVRRLVPLDQLRDIGKYKRLK